MKFIQFAVIMFLLLFPLTVNANESKQKLDLTVDPQNVLFDISNLKLGDSMERVLVVTNNGKESFNYKTTSRQTEGSEKLYDSLYIKISNNQGTLYEGRLSNFSGLASRYLDKEGKEELMFSVKIPKELGNEYQGLYSKVQFKFYVEGTLGGLLPANGLKLPNTGSNMFNILSIGFIFTLIGLFNRYKGKIKKLIKGPYF